MSDLLPMTDAQMRSLAASAVTKIDLKGRRGVTDCSMDEIEAMALLIASSAILPPLKDRIAQTPQPTFKSTRTAV